MSEVFVKIKNEQVGPLSFSEIGNLVANGEFEKDDLVFEEDSQEWVRAHQVDEFKHFFNNGADRERKRTVYAIGGGKGGIGKTVLTASIGIGMASMGKDVIIVDADLGGANLHTCMGILEPEYTFYHFYTLQRESLKDICLETPIDNLRLISGSCGTLGLANPRYHQKQKFIRHLHKLDADHILLDLGAGSSYNVIDFFIAADEGILITTPEPTAIQETFNFLKKSIMRKLMRDFRKNSPVEDIFDSYLNSEPGKMQFTMHDIIRDVKEVDTEGAAYIEDFISNYHPKLILNMVHSLKEIKEGDAFKTASHELLGVDVDYIGYVDYDNNVRKSVKQLRPFIVANPKSRASKSLTKLITVGIMQKQGWKAYRDRRHVTRNLKEESHDYPENNLGEGETICSVNCFYWGECEYQQGGYPCPIRNFNPIFKRY